MAKRVMQADGTYCHTENCRIHDRSGAPTTGHQAVVADQQRIQHETTNQKLNEILKHQLLLNDDDAKALSNDLQHINLHSGDLAGNVMQHLEPVCISRAIDPGVFIRIATNVIDELEGSSNLAPGDTVVLNATGERGLILAGDSRFGEKLLFLPEKNSSPNVRKEFNREDFTKVTENSGSLARERIFSMHRHDEVPPALVKQLMAEETAKDTQNAQAAPALSEYPHKEAEFAREHMVSLAEKYHKEGPLTRSEFVKWLKRNHTAPIPEADRQSGDTGKWFAVKKGMSNVIRYLDPSYGTLPKVRA